MITHPAFVTQNHIFSFIIFVHVGLIHLTTPYVPLYTTSYLLPVKRHIGCVLVLVSSRSDPEPRIQGQVLYPEGDFCMHWQGSESAKGRKPIKGTLLAGSCCGECLGDSIEHSADLTQLSDERAGGLIHQLQSPLVICYWGRAVNSLVLQFRSKH